MTKLNQTKEKINGNDIKFYYDGFWRHVSNITLEEKTLIGFEVRKSGKWSYKIKRYSLDKIKDLEFIPEITRSGPKIGRPGRTSSSSKHTIS